MHALVHMDKSTTYVWDNAKVQVFCICKDHIICIDPLTEYIPGGLEKQ